MKVFKVLGYIAKGFKFIGTANKYLTAVSAGYEAFNEELKKQGINLEEKKDVKE